MSVHRYCKYGMSNFSASALLWLPVLWGACVGCQGLHELDSEHYEYRIAGGAFSTWALRIGSSPRRLRSNVLIGSSWATRTATSCSDIQCDHGHA